MINSKPVIGKMTLFDIGVVVSLCGFVMSGLVVWVGLVLMCIDILITAGVKDETTSNDRQGD